MDGSALAVRCAERPMAKGSVPVSQMVYWYACAGRLTREPSLTGKQYLVKMSRIVRWANVFSIKAVIGQKGYALCNLAPTVLSLIAAATSRHLAIAARPARMKPSGSAKEDRDLVLEEARSEQV
jgi:hypothetical protein